MREIKLFRTWDNVDKKYTSRPIYLSNEGCVVVNDGGAYDRLDVIVDRYEIEFFTGLRDKNDKDLDWWEGDIFQLGDTGFHHVIVFKDGCFWFERAEAMRTPCWMLTEHGQMKKAGDIHSNPELMEAR